MGFLPAHATGWNQSGATVHTSQFFLPLVLLEASLATQSHNMELQHDVQHHWIG
jgi:hypothetical protein